MISGARLACLAAWAVLLCPLILRPAVAGGAVVLSDRFLDSTTVYQGVARRLSRQDVAAVNGFAVGGTLPDLTLVFDLPVDLALQRVAARRGPRPDRMEEEPASFYEAVRSGYLELARAEPDRVRVLDGRLSEEEVAREVRRVLEERCHGLFGG